MPKPVLPAKRRRKGFESVRKDSCRAYARPLFFEKELLYCKLTAASAIQKGLLRVSFGAVGSRCRCALKKALLYRIALHELKKPPIFTNQKPCFYPNFFLFPPKATLFHPPPPIRITLNLLFAKNTAVLLLFALNPCAVKPERRTDSNHCRRYPAKLRLFTKPVT